MPKKKQPKNAFYFYMRDFKEDEEQRGRRFPNGMKEVAKEAGPKWAELSPEERLRYENLAAESKLKEKGDLSNKFTTMGISYAQLQKEEMVRKQTEMRMKMEIVGTVQGLNRDTTLKTHTFYFVHFNFYCRTDDGLYLTCEVAVAQFSLEAGVKDMYHTIIRQEKIPTGYSYEAKSTSDDTHQIPLPYDLTEGEPPRGQLFINIKRFLEPNKMPNGDLPPLYAIDNHVDIAQSVLTEMAEFHYPQNPDIFRVYPLSKLFYNLRNAASLPSNQAFPVETLALRELDKDQYNYAPGIACVLHEKNDTCVYCSKSIVTRWGFLICDHCCKDLKIPMVRGKHIPINAAIHEEEKLEDGFGFQTKRKAKMPSTMNSSSAATMSYSSSHSSTMTSHSAASVISEGPKLLESARPQIPLQVTDLGKAGPSEDCAHHYNINAASASVPAQSWPIGNCWAQKPDIGPLRRPSKLPASVQDAIHFSNEDFPDLGSRNRVKMPAAVAGRGRGRARILQDETSPGDLNEDPDDAKFQVPPARDRPMRFDGKPGSRLAANLQGLNLN